MAIHKSGEDYLEAILMIRLEKGYCRSIDVAHRLNVSKPSVSVAMGHLRQGGRPVEVRRKAPLPVQQVAVVSDVQLIQSGRSSRPGHVHQACAAVRGNLGVGVHIRQIHPHHRLSFFFSAKKRQHPP